jgi:nucleoside-diphosphate-sugar epimerase
MTAWWVVGCGYTGRALARRLAETGAQVTVTRKIASAARADAAAVGAARGVARDHDDEPELDSADAIVVDLVPPSATPGDREAALVAGCGRRKPARIVYVSSTAVYAPGGGAAVDESWPLEPATETGRRRLAAEAALRDAADRAGIPWTILRPAGIYGPDRGLIARIRAGTYRIVGDGTSHVSRIHVDDVVSSIVAAGTGTATGIFNVADDDPSPIGEVADVVAAALAAHSPPRVPADSVSPEIAGMLVADRRIDNTRLKRELGVELKFPSWRHALQAALPG